MEQTTTFHYQRHTHRKVAMMLTGICFCVITLLLDVMTGSSQLPLGEVVRTIFNPDQVEKISKVIVWNMRLPVALMGLVVGAALGLAGATMQTILNNPLASPYTLGLSAGAGFGASVALILGLGEWLFFSNILVPLCAFLFSLLACLGIYLISKRKRFTPSILVLSGIGMVFFFEAGQSFLQYLATPEELTSLIFWTFGSLTKANWGNLGVLSLVFFFAFLFIVSKSWLLTAMSMGDERAKSMGVNTEKLRMEMFLVISLLTATAVAFVGSIGFVGIVGPHVARILLGEDQRFFLPTSAICGAVILSVASAASKIIVPGAIFPIGILTSLIGVPVFFALIIKKR